MTSEKSLTPQQERSPNGEHNQDNLDVSTLEQQERIREKHEQVDIDQERKDKEQDIAQARERAHNTAEPAHDQHITPSPAERRRSPVATKQQREKSYRSHLKDARHDMSKSEQLFSTVIHAAPVEKASELAGSTIARPNALLSGSIAAFITITVLYFAAKHYGFQLSGFETIAAFVGGWLLGILYDYVALMIRGKRQ